MNLLISFNLKGEEVISDRHDKLDSTKKGEEDDTNNNIYVDILQEVQDLVKRFLENSRRRLPNVRLLLSFAHTRFLHLYNLYFNYQFYPTFLDPQSQFPLG